MTTPDTSTCQHENFEALCDIGRLFAEVGGPITGYTIGVRVKCRDCALPFRFIGIAAGNHFAEPRVSIDGCELRAALEAADLSVTGTPQEGAPRKVTQTQTGPDGNCQSACLSMLLGIPLADIPNFTLAGDDDACFAAQQKWLAERGWGIVTIGAKGPFFKKWFGKGYTLAGGTSPRGLPHAVIYKDGELWHDPHPDGTGITEVTEVDILWPLNPSAWAILPANLAAARQERDDMMAMFDAVDIFMRYSTDGGATWQEYTLEERVRLAIAVCCDDDAEQRLAAAEARAEKAERERCSHGWRGTVPEDGQRIVTPCPECGSQSLFIGSGGHLTCARVPTDHGDGCPSPSVEATVKHLKDGLSEATCTAEQARATAMESLSELQNIANAERFNRERFSDDTAFADWAQSRLSQSPRRPRGRHE